MASADFSRRDPAAPLTVHVRSPTLTDSISVTTTLDATISSFKRALQNVHPVRPEPSDQRLIYQGKLLADKDVLKEVLKKSDLSTEPIFHLVVKTSYTTTSAPYAYSSNVNQLHQQRAPVQQQQQQIFATGNVYQPPAMFASWPMGQTFSQPAQLQAQQVLPGYQYAVINGHLVPIPYAQPPAFSYSYATPTQPLAHSLITDPAIAAYHQYYHDLIVRYAQQQQQQFVAAAVAQNAFVAHVPPAADNPAALAERHGRRRLDLSLLFKLILMIIVFGRGASFERIVMLLIVATVIILQRLGRLTFVVRRVNVGGIREEVVPAPLQPGAVPQPPPQPTATPAPPPARPVEQQPAQPAEQPARPTEQPVQLAPPAPSTIRRQIEHALYTFVKSLIPSSPDQAAAPADPQDLGEL